MFFVFTIFVGVVAWILGLVFVIPARKHVGMYSALSILFFAAALILFTFLSSWFGILPLRLLDNGLIQYGISFPNWYLEHGALGIALIILWLCTMVSPLIAAWLMMRQFSTLRAS